MAKRKEAGGKAVVYARYSSHNQRDVSIEQQYAACDKFAAESGFSIVGRYADRAISGKTDNRPQFQRMMRDAHKGEFDFVIAWKSNRMGRNMMQAMVNEAKLADLGIRCLYVEEDFDDSAAGRFSLRTMMNVNQFYSDALAEDVKRGMLDNASRCMVNNLPPFGYKKGSDGRFEIVETEAEIVREIYSRIIAGWSIYDIQTDLNRRGIRTRRGGEWKKQSFGKLLTNDKYIGVYRYADVITEGGVPAILDRSTFDRVQKILVEKKKPRGKQRMNDEYLLSGKCFCGKCGSPMGAQCGTSKTGKKFDYYMCNRRRYDHACDKENVPKDRLERAVAEIIKAQLMDDALIDWIIAGYERALAQARDDTKRQQLQEELEDVNTRLQNILAAIEAGIFNEQTQQRMTELNAARKDLEEALRLEEAANTFPSPEEVRFNLTELRAGDLNDRRYMKDLIKTFVRAVYVYDDKLKILFNYGKEKDISRPLREESTPGAEPGTCSRQVSNGAPNVYFVNTYAEFFEVLVPFRR